MGYYGGGECGGGCGGNMELLLALIILLHFMTPGSCYGPYDK